MNGVKLGSSKDGDGKCRVLSALLGFAILMNSAGWRCSCRYKTMV
jgi:hypothetical protein